MPTKDTFTLIRDDFTKDDVPGWTPRQQAVTDLQSLTREGESNIAKLSALADELKVMRDQVGVMIEAKTGQPLRGDNFRSIGPIDGENI